MEKHRGLTSKVSVSAADSLPCRTQYNPRWLQMWILGIRGLVGTVGPYLGHGSCWGSYTFGSAPGLPSLIVQKCVPLKKKSGQAFKGGVLLKEEEHDGLALIMFKMLKNQVPLRQTLSPSR